MAVGIVVGCLVAPVVAGVVVLLGAVADPEGREQHAPTPTNRPMKPSATGPTPPRSSPPGLVGVLDVLHHVADDVDDLRR